MTRNSAGTVYVPFVVLLLTKWDGQFVHFFQNQTHVCTKYGTGAALGLQRHCLPEEHLVSTVFAMALVLWGHQYASDYFHFVVHNALDEKAVPTTQTAAPTIGLPKHTPILHFSQISEPSTSIHCHLPRMQRAILHLKILPKSSI